jgi:hypothetical protein
MSRMLWTVLLCVLALACASCSDDDDAAGGDASSATTADRAGDAHEVPVELLDSWSDELVEAFEVLGERREAVRAGEVARLESIDRRVRAKLRPVLEYGKTARIQLLDFSDVPVARRTIAAGDGWTEFALTVTNTPAANFKQARKLADLGAEAVRRHQAAYSAAGEDVPPAFASGQE